jgi:very-short-patch-repair endonuclease
VVDVVRGKVRRVGWSAVTPGAHVAAQDPVLADRLRAWALVLPKSAAFTHLTAAELRGWWLPAAVPRPVFAAVPLQDRHPQRRGLRMTRLAAVAAEPVAGIPVTTAAETLLACARDLEVLDLVPLADSALRLGHCEPDEMAALAATRRPGARMLRRVLPLLDRRSESAWESVLRVLHVAVDVPVEPQHVVRDAAGAFVARADLWLVGTRRLHEYDGEVHRDRHTHRADLDRDRRLVEAGWQRCGYTATEVLRRGGSIIASADAVLGRGWDPGRLNVWRGLVRASLYGPEGRARVRSRWRTNC